MEFTEDYMYGRAEQRRRQLARAASHGNGGAAAWAATEHLVT
jgi:hypothetical protein